MLDTIKILMHAIPSHIDRAEVIESLMQIKVSGIFKFLLASASCGMFIGIFRVFLWYMI